MSFDSYTNFDHIKLRIPAKIEYSLISILYLQSLLPIVSNNEPCDEEVHKHVQNKISMIYHEVELLKIACSHSEFKIKFLSWMKQFPKFSVYCLLVQNIKNRSLEPHTYMDISIGSIIRIL